MLKFKDFFTALFVTVLVALPAVSMAQGGGEVTVPVMTGSKSGSYFKFASQAASVCAADIRLEVKESAGSTANLDALEANDTALAISQIDIMDLYKKTKDMSNVKVLVPLFPEQVHFVTRSDVVKVEGGVTILGRNFGGDKTQLQTALDLANRKVAAAGGSFKTAQVISYLGGLPMQLTEVGGADAAIAGVVNGTYDAAILVGAQPLGTITAMGDRQKSLRLLPVPEALMSKLGVVYTKASPLTYRTMGAGGDNVPAIQVMSALVTQNYPKSAIGDSIYRFQQCLLREASQQATIPGNHPAWRNLKLTTGLNWDIWQYQGAQTLSQGGQVQGTRRK